MSLYTLEAKGIPKTVNSPSELRVEESTNLELLSVLAATTVPEIARRIANDNVAFVAFLNNVPVAFGWMARGKAPIGELNHELILPYGHRYLWNFRTLEPFRGLGIYPALLKHIIAFEQERAERFWIIHAPENEASLRGIQKAGFEFIGKAYNTGKHVTVEATASAIAYSDVLEEMDIRLSDAQPVSCWNCSSPYLKKRKDECCCAASGKVCVGHNLSELTTSSPSGKSAGL